MRARRGWPVLRSRRTQRVLLLTTAGCPARPPRPAAVGRVVGVLPLPGGPESVREAVERLRPTMLVVLLSPHAPPDLVPTILALPDLELPVEIVPWHPLSRRAGPEGVFYAAPLRGAPARRKRLLDLLLTLPALLPALPLMALIALAIRLDSPGPALFRQPRIGRHAMPFDMFKFRTMYHQTEQAEATLGTPPGTSVTADALQPRYGIEYKLPQDPRITRLGRFLRRSSLDELPQLFNVLRGEMSLVGPRPELPLAIERYSTAQLARLAVPPGMTGWWQVQGRSNRPLPVKIADDLYYIEHISLTMDLRILAQTVRAVLRGTGAY